MLSPKKRPKPLPVFSAASPTIFLTSIPTSSRSHPPSSLSEASSPASLRHLRSTETDSLYPNRPKNKPTNSPPPHIGDEATATLPAVDHLHRRPPSPSLPQSRLLSSTTISSKHHRHHHLISYAKGNNSTIIPRSASRRPPQSEPEENLLLQPVLPNVGKHQNGIINHNQKNSAKQKWRNAKNERTSLRRQKFSHLPERHHTTYLIPEEKSPAKSHHYKCWRNQSHHSQSSGKSRPLYIYKGLLPLPSSFKLRAKSTLNLINCSTRCAPPPSTLPGLLPTPPLEHRLYPFSLYHRSTCFKQKLPLQRAPHKYMSLCSRSQLGSNLLFLFRKSKQKTSRSPWISSWKNFLLTPSTWIQILFGDKAHLNDKSTVFFNIVKDAEINFSEKLNLESKKSIVELDSIIEDVSYKKKTPKILGSLQDSIGNLSEPCKNSYVSTQVSINTQVRINVIDEPTNNLKTCKKIIRGNFVRHRISRNVILSKEDLHSVDWVIKNTKRKWNIIGVDWSKPNKRRRIVKEVVDEARLSRWTNNKGTNGEYSKLSSQVDQEFYSSMCVPLDERLDEKEDTDLEQNDKLVEDKVAREIHEETIVEKDDMADRGENGDDNPGSQEPCCPEEAPESDLVIEDEQYEVMKKETKNFLMEPDDEEPESEDEEQEDSNMDYNGDEDESNEESEDDSLDDFQKSHRPVGGHARTEKLIRKEVIFRDEKDEEEPSYVAEDTDDIYQETEEYEDCENESLDGSFDFSNPDLV